MRRILLGVCMLVFAGTAAAQSSTGPLIVLVPGFFNSLAPGSSEGPYFSRTVLNTLGRGGQVIVVNNLSPVGGVAENGQLLSTFLSKVVAQNPGRPMVLITHSAGGFYAFYALTHHPEFPVRTIVTLALPYRGVEWITNLALAYPELETIVDYLSLDSLKEFESANALKLQAGFRLPDGLRVIAVAGTQEPCFGVDCAMAQNLSWPLTLTQTIMSEASDGIVTIDSALGSGLKMQSASGKAIEIERWNNVNLGLEHWEMVLESSLVHLVGVVNTGYIDRRQQKMYSLILRRLGMLPN